MHYDTRQTTAVDEDFRDIETTGGFRTGRISLAQIGERTQAQFLLLPTVHRLQGESVRCTAPRFYLDEDERGLLILKHGRLFCDQVDLALRTAEIGGQNVPAVPFQILPYQKLALRSHPLIVFPADSFIVLILFITAFR